MLVLLLVVVTLVLLVLWFCKLMLLMLLPFEMIEFDIEELAEDERDDGVFKPVGKGKFL